MRGLRIVLAVALPMLASASLAADTERPDYAQVLPGKVFSFPADHGAHPDFRTEWWYVTGWLDTGEGKPLGFQVTFFRTRPATDQRNPSAFAARQVLFAHAALSDPGVGRLLHDQRVARTGFGLAEASTADADIVLDDWCFKRESDGRFQTKVGGKDFTLDLSFVPSQPVLLEGENGLSRKGPLAAQASYYYSLPHLTVSGSVTRGGQVVPVKGTAWLDREWSSSYLDPNASGWDWTGLNLDDGGALMAFQMRGADGRAIWAGGTLRDAANSVNVLKPEDVRFDTVRSWRSPRTGTDYPVERRLTIRLPTGERQFPLKPLFDDQELDSRGAGGPVYWEGAVQTQGGRGYLELTGYFQKLKM
jgi:predicted secreted hydrolase